MNSDNEMDVLVKEVTEIVNDVKENGDAEEVFELISAYEDGINNLQKLKGGHLLNRAYNDLLDKAKRTYNINVNTCDGVAYISKR